VESNLFADLPSDSILGGFSSRDASTREGPLFATIGITHQEQIVPMLDHALYTERLWSHEKPVKPEAWKQHLDEGSFAHGSFTPRVAPQWRRRITLVSARWFGLV
jgi:hypothetical protein